MPSMPCPTVNPCRYACQGVLPSVGRYRYVPESAIRVSLAKNGGGASHALVIDLQLPIFLVAADCVDSV